MATKTSAIKHVNSVTIEGYLGRDAEVGGKGDKAPIILNLGSSDDYKLEEKIVEHCNWVRIKVFNGLREYAATLKKGDHIIILGKIRVDSVVDEAGNKTSYFGIQANEIRCLGRKQQQAQPEEPEVEQSGDIPF